MVSVPPPPSSTPTSAETLWIPSAVSLVICQNSTCKAIPGNDCDGKSCLYRQPNPLGRFPIVTCRVVQNSVLELQFSWPPFSTISPPKLSTTYDEVKVFPIPAALYLFKNLLQYYIFAYVDAPGYQILKNLNIISTGVLYRIILKKKLSEIQWAGFILLCCGCTTAQLNSSSDRVLQTSLPGWIMAIVMALLSGFAGVYTEAIIKKRPSRNINVQNFWLYVFGMAFNAVAIVIQDFDAVKSTSEATLYFKCTLVKFTH
ncbi:unnamed protein product [Microthlaspi erraticum]|uniref:Uncharacterized protein n=1 Tax=Microthlaspi erraticum TaxID=1685480 RepID=A0A6D2K8G0_9BRAS|nr:unnamed protein product [Microthlaspi erraticum]